MIIPRIDIIVNRIVTFGLTMRMFGMVQTVQQEGVIVKV